MTLEGHGVRLLPLSESHVPALQQAAADGELWQLRYTSVPSAESTLAYVQAALAAQARGDQRPYAIEAAGRVVGSTRFLNIVAEHKRLEIGSTWVARSVQGTHVNPAAKLLLMTEAFEVLGCNRVEFMTHHANHQSQAAIAKLGAVREGVLRNHKVMPDGSLRDTVAFSVIATDWPGVKAGLRRRLAG